MANEEEELQELEDELKELEKIQSTSNDYGSPSPEKKDNMFKFFREILSMPESWKVGNLQDTEIGKTELSTRSYLDLGLYAGAEGLDDVKQYFRDKADIVAAPTMGRKGFMSQLFVTQIKKEQKIKDPIKKRGLFFGGGKDKNEQ